MLANGHNRDDEAQAVLMNIFGATLQLAGRMGPRAGIKTDAKFIPRVKPLYFIGEEDAIYYSKTKGFPVHYGECPCSADTYRREIKRLFLSLDNRENIKENIMKSFMAMKPKMMQYYSNDAAIGECEICGEPTSQRVCNVCQLKMKITVDA